MSDLISREAFKDKYLCCGWLPEMSKNQFDAFPAVDAVEVVFCKDCQHRETTNCVTPEMVNDCDYCSWGKRRESEASK